jgi:hypothetical protein
LSDERGGFGIPDRAGFQRFPGIAAEGVVPDRTSVWNFREKPGETGAARLFDFFHGKLAEKGRIIDATFTDAPRQRSNRSKSRVRARGEHAFAFMTGVMKAGRIRTIGMKRAERTNALVNLVYRRTIDFTRTRAAGFPFETGSIRNCTIGPR